MIANKLIECVSRVTIVDKGNMRIAFENIKAIGSLREPEFRQLTNMGFPVANIVSNILNISIDDTIERIKTGKITYSDMLCVLGIFAQDSIVLHQRNKLK